MLNQHQWQHKFPCSARVSLFLWLRCCQQVRRYSSRVHSDKTQGYSQRHMLHWAYAEEPQSKFKQDFNWYSVIAMAFPITRFARAVYKKDQGTQSDISGRSKFWCRFIFNPYNYSVPDFFFFFSCHTKRGFQYCVYQFYITHR